MQFLKNIFNIWWLKWTWPLKLASVLAVLIIFSLLFGSLRSCGRSNPRLNEAEIQRGEQAIRDRNKAELVEVLTKIEVQEQAINANLAAGKTATMNALHESRTKYSQMTIEQLQAEFEKAK